MEEPTPGLPYATLRLTDDGVPHGQVVEVIVDGEAVAQLNTSRIGYELTVHGRGLLQIGVPLKHPIELETEPPSTGT